MYNIRYPINDFRFYGRLQTLGMLNFFKRDNTDAIKRALNRTQNSMFGQITQIFNSTKIDQSTYEELEDILISSDIGINTSEIILGKLQSEIDNLKSLDSNALHKALKDILKVSLLPMPDFWLDHNNQKVIILILGVNGAGKTTSLSKLAYLYKSQNKTVIAGAADTFRPAAIEQLKIWGTNIGFDVIAHKSGSDPGSVAFDTINAAKTRGTNITLIDTAGRLHSESNLMNELVKIHNVTLKVADSIPVKVVLNIDATTGQNGLKQAEAFKNIIPCDGIFLSKLDGTSKGGIVFPISQQLGIPILFVGTGESSEDIAFFDRDTFVDNMFTEHS